MRALAVIALLGGCIDIADVHRCTGNEDCIRDGVGGRCEASGFCTFADATCGGDGFRYHDRAGDHANICVVSGTAVSAVKGTELVKDATIVTCGADGARDAYFEITSPGPQVLFIDTAQEDTNTATTIAVRMGPCPGTTEIGCLSNACGALPYGQLATTIGPGTSCIVVEEAVSGSSDARVGLRIAPAGRPGAPLDMGMPFPWTTCDQPNNQAAFIFGVCPGGARMKTSVDPFDEDGLDVALSVRTLLPQGPLIGVPVNDTGPSQLETIDVMVMDPGAYWLLVERGSASGPACGRVMVAPTITRSALR